MPYRLEAMNLSATHMDRMVDFYTHVFGMALEEEALGDDKVYSGTFAGLDFALVPAALTKVDARQNRMQLDIVVDDIHDAIARVEAHSGRTNQRLGEDESFLVIGIYDPDDNFMVFRQPKQPAS